MLTGWRSQLQISVQTRGGSHFCGATLIDPYHVVTSAHCVHDFKGVPKPMAKVNMIFFAIIKQLRNESFSVPTDGRRFGGKPYRIHDSSNSITQPDICASLLQALNTGKRCGSAQNISSILCNESFRSSDSFGCHPCLLQKMYGCWVGSNGRGML